MRIRERPSGHVGRLGALVALTVVVPVAAGLACGPDFPTSPLFRRSATLLATPVGSFAFEMSRLMKRPTDGFRVVELDGTTTRSVEEAETDGATILAMRHAEDGPSAYAAGAGVPDGVRLYTAGAVSFHRAFGRDESGSVPEGAAPDPLHLAAARERFAAVVALPAAEGEARVVWAEFMLGRIAAREANDGEAAAHFQRTRMLVRAGHPDPLGLAVASLGEEARLHVRPGTLARAIDLYAQQASYGSTSGVESLRQLARMILRSNRLLDEAFADPLGRKLVFLYAFTYAVHECCLVDEPVLDDEAPGATDAALPFLDRLVRVIEDQPGDVENADEVARLAYEAGDYELARRMTAKSSTGLARWIDAKLALRRGDETAALGLYADALKRLPPPSLPPDPGGMPSQRELTEMEVGLLHVTRAEFMTALERFYAAAPRYWLEAAYVAERLVDVEELKAFVDRHAPPTSAAALAAAAESGEVPPAAQLRALLGRRLLRSGQLDEAVRYFDDEELRGYARAYADALRGACNDWSPTTRARDWYTAGTLSRRHGLELVGFELSPDWAVYGGEFGDEWFAVGLAGDARDADEDRLTPSERERFAATHPSPNARFHYRYLAADYGEHAAAALPPDSQAFAAVLCHATAWIIGTDPTRAAALYARYVREGPYVPWAESFGRRCPEPDFDGARWWRTKRTWARLRRATVTYPGVVAAAGLAAAFFLVAAVMLFRRRDASET